MVRVKRGTVVRQKRKRLFRQVKGFRWGRKNRYRLAKDALRHALTHSYTGRKRKKREMRKLWQIQINAACRAEGISYSNFIYSLKKGKIELDRKVLSEIAKNYPDIFKIIVEKAKEGAK